MPCDCWPRPTCPWSGSLARATRKWRECRHAQTRWAQVGLACSCWSGTNCHSSPGPQCVYYAQQDGDIIWSQDMSTGQQPQAVNISGRNPPLLKVCSLQAGSTVNTHPGVRGRCCHAEPDLRKALEPPEGLRRWPLTRCALVSNTSYSTFPPLSTVAILKFQTAVFGRFVCGTR